MRPGHEEEAPVVRVEQQDEREREHGQVAAAAEREGVEEGGGRDEPEEDDEGVHPRLLRIDRQEGVEGREDRGDPPRARAEEAPAGPEGDGNRDERDDERERVRGALGRPEDVHPDVEQEVVERGRAVLLEDAGDLGEREGGDPDREAFVDPVAREDRTRPEVGRERRQRGESRERQRDAEEAGVRQAERAPAHECVCRHAGHVSPRSPEAAPRMRRGPSTARSPRAP